MYPAHPCQNLTQIIHTKIYPDYSCQNVPILSMPNFTDIIHAKFYPCYPYQNLPSSSMPKFNPDLPYQNLPTLSLPKFTQIIRAKIYRHYQWQILPRLSMPNSKYRILIGPDVCFSKYRAHLSVDSLAALLCTLRTHLWPALSKHEPLRNKSGVRDFRQNYEILDLHSAAARSINGQNCAVCRH
jgi:hypothetical protein